MDATRVRGLLPIHDLVLLDEPQQWIIGIASIRGHDFPVIDLRGKLGIVPGSHGRTPCIVAVEAEGPKLIGFVADRVSRVLQIRNADADASTMRICGRTRRVLDLDQILTSDNPTITP